MRLSPIARDVAEARAIGISYGMLQAMRYSTAKSAATRYCPNCGKPITSKRRIYCDALCSNRYRGRKYYAKKKRSPGLPSGTSANKINLPIV